MLAANTSIGSNSTGSLLDADPLNDLDDLNLSHTLSPVKSPLSLHPVDGPSTMHDAPPSPTDTNTLVVDIQTSSTHIWQPSESYLDDRRNFDIDHKDLLSPTDTNSLIDEGMANFGKARLSFSPLEGRRKLDFDSYLDLDDEGLVRGDDGVVSIARTSPQPVSRRSPLLEERREVYTMSSIKDEDLGDMSQMSLTPRERGPIKAGDIYSSIMSQARSRTRQGGPTGQSTPSRSSPGTNYRLDSQSHRQGLGQDASPLAKESKKSVRFMLGDSKDGKDSDIDISAPVRELSKGPQTPYNANLSQRMSDSLDINQNVLKLVESSPNLNKSNSNSNNMSLIDTSALLLTPQEKTYSTLIMGQGRSNYSSKTESKSPTDETSKQNLMPSVDLGSKHKSKFSSPAKTYSFSLHGEGSSTESSPVSVPLHVSTHSSSTSNLSLHSHPNHDPLSHPVSLSVSTNLTDPSSTASPPSTNQSQGSTMDSSLSSLAGHPLGSESDSSLHHVHHLLTPAPEPPQHLPDPERSQGHQGVAGSGRGWEMEGRHQPEIHG